MILLMIVNTMENVADEPPSGRTKHNGNIVSAASFEPPMLIGFLDT